MKKSYSVIILILVLSLSIFAQKKISDRENDGLKNLVKSVSTEIADYEFKSGKLKESKRRLKEAVTYDLNGNRLTWKTYDYLTGTLFESGIYDRIDGETVIKYEEVENPNKIVQINSAPDAENLKKFDSRYDYKFKFKHDTEGNISEESWYQSDGSLWLRYVYNLKEKQKEELVYDADGTLNQKYVYNLDNKGNVVEMLAYDTENNKLEGKEIYKYLEFDAKGNWTKRITSEGDEDNNFIVKPREVLYRKITYF